jgi:chromosome partitioning protein
LSRCDIPEVIGMLIVVGGEKGGTSKTTISVHLAGLLARERASCALVNCDPQETAVHWSNARTAYDVPQVSAMTIRGPNIARTLADLRDRYDHVIVDVSGEDSVELRAALLVADCQLMPLRPNGFDLWTVAKAAGITRGAQDRNPRLVALVVATQVPGASRDRLRQGMKLAFDGLADDLREVFRLIDPIIGFRMSFPDATTQGLLVHETRPRDSKACAEMSHVFQEVMSHVEAPA